MNRLLKFRAWDKMSRQWLFPNDKMPDWSGGSKDAICFWCYKDIGLGVHSVSSSTVEITQFTGLLDSKGREIWEGDILSYKDWHGRPFVVRWDMHHGNHSVGYVYGFAMPDRGFGPWEVIGNVFENKDLLN